MRRASGIAMHRRLDALNFLLADAQGALGPILTVFLVSELHWGATRAGVITTSTGLLTIAAQTPIGAFLDRTRAYSTGLRVALAVMAVGGGMIYAMPTFAMVFVASMLVGLAGDVCRPAVTAITVNSVGEASATARLGRNAVFDHIGNVFAAAVVGLVGWMWTQRAVFLTVPVFALAAMVAVPRTRGAPARDQVEASDPGGMRALWSSRPFIALASSLAAFHLANAAMLPLVGQKLALAHHDSATMMVSACIIAAQVIMIPCAAAVGRFADRIGRKPFLIAAFAILPLRAFLYLASDSAPWLIGVQLLDGVGAGILSALTPVMVADTMRGKPHVALAQSVAATTQGIGAAISGLVAGAIVDSRGYDATFIVLGVAAALALALVWATVAETSPHPLPNRVTA